MNMNRTFLVGFCFVFSTLVFSPLSIYASTDLVEGISTSCPLYNVRGVSVSLSASQTASLGAEVPFSATITNNNPFPVIDGSLFVRIEDSSGKIYDRFFVTHTKAIGAGDSITAPFSWKVPAFGLPSSYVARAYFLSAKQFHLGGVTFVEGLSVGETTFRVIGDNKQYVSFDKSSLVVNGERYNSRGGAVVGSKDPVSISVSVTHNLAEKKNIPVTWKIYRWDAITEDNLIASFVDTAVLSPGKAGKATVNFDDNSASSYQIVGELSSNDAKSIVTARINRQGVSDSMVRLVALSHFPTSSSVPAKIFGCIDNTLSRSDSDLYPKKLVVMATDSSGRTVVSESYEISRSPIVGFVKTITPSNRYPHLDIRVALLSREGSIEQEVSVTYDCKDIGDAGCTAPVGDDVWPYVHIVATVTGAFVLALILRRRIHRAVVSKNI
jgi:hypothetical protein